MIKITIPGNPATKKNSMRVFTQGNKPVVLPSKAFVRWQEEAGWHLGAHKGIEINKPVNVKCLFFMFTQRKVDLVNLLSAVDDMLVYYGVLSDDNCRIVASHDGSRVLYDKANPRVEIEIEKRQ